MVHFIYNFIKDDFLTVSRPTFRCRFLVLELFIVSVSGGKAIRRGGGGGNTDKT